MKPLAWIVMLAPFGFILAMNLDSTVSAVASLDSLSRSAP